MTREEYERRLDGNEFKDDILPVFEFFEKYLDNENNRGSDYINNIKHEMEAQKVRYSITQLLRSLYRKKREILISFCWSLLRNVQQFEKMDNEVNNDKRIIKWKKCGYSYINLSRNLIYDLQIEEQLKKERDIQKIVLCVSLVNLDDDDIRVNDEIDNIQVKSANSGNSTYLVITIHGSSFDQFINHLQKNHITHIHIAGHANCNELDFAGVSITYDHFRNHISQLDFVYELLFLNCCQTYDYLQQTAFPYSQKSICYETNLLPSIAWDASNIFYTCLFSGLSIDDSWNGIINSLGDYNYHLLW